MLRPSYHDLVDTVKRESGEEDDAIVSSRYSIVIAAAKRARQIIAGDEPLVKNADSKKPLSSAVEEIREGEVKIFSGECEDEGYASKNIPGHSAINEEALQEEVMDEDASMEEEYEEEAEEESGEEREDSYS